MKKLKNIFITGTDTDVGKTIVSAALAATILNEGYKTGVYKPFQSGCIYENDRLSNPDPDFIYKINSKILVKSSYNLICPSAPHLAASLENININKELILADYGEMAEKCDFLIVEGSGGLLVPVNDNLLIRDYIKILDLPLIIVARPDLGTINHVLLTIEAAKSYNIEVLGVIISNYPENTDDLVIKTAPEYIKQFSGVDILGILPNIPDIDCDNLIAAAKNHLNINKIIS